VRINGNILRNESRPLSKKNAEAPLRGAELWLRESAEPVAPPAP
jgi:Tfp pilus assembly protein PilX